MIMMMYVGNAQGVVAVLAAESCCHGDGQQQCVVAMEEMPGYPLATMYCSRSDNITLATMYCTKTHTHTQRSL